MLIFNKKDLGSYLGCGPDGIERSVYKYTDCGAWIELHDPAQLWDGTLYDGGVRIGSIVEGADDCTEVHTLHYPFPSEEWGEALDAVEKEANEIWMRTHGCSKCWDGQTTYDEWGNESGPEDYGHRPVDPDCKECMGIGVVV